MADIKVGTLAAKTLKLGESQIQKIQLGTNTIWQNWTLTSGTISFPTGTITNENSNVYGKTDVSYNINTATYPRGIKFRTIYINQGGAYAYIYGKDASNNWVYIGNGGYTHGVNENSWSSMTTTNDTPFFGIRVRQSDDSTQFRLAGLYISQWMQ